MGDGDEQQSWAERRQAERRRARGLDDSRPTTAADRIRNRWISAAVLAVLGLLFLAGSMTVVAVLFFIGAGVVAVIAAVATGVRESRD